MRKALKVVSIIAIVFGGLAILSAFGETGEDVGYTFLGGAMFAAQGILALIYIKQVDNK